MNLTIDQGNSRTKVALFDKDGKIKKSFIYRTFTSADIERLFALYNIEASIISSVISIEPAIVNALNRLSKHFILFDHLTPVPLKNDYDTPETLGQDRLAAAIGAAYLCPNENLLIIDAGSAITFDFVSEDNTFLGGNITAGIKMRFKALHQMTKKLPLVDADENELMPLIAKNTRDAIVTGVIRGISMEVKGYIRALKENVAHSVTFLTGGHAPYILHHVAGDEIRYEKNLVLIGLNRILNYNAQ